MKAPWFTLVLLGCDSAATSEQLDDIIATSRCIDVSTFLVKDDVAFASANQLAMQNALGSSKVFCVPKGEYFFARPNPATKIASIDLISLTDVSFIGGGESSAFTMYESSPGGDCLVNCSIQGSGCTPPAFWYLFRLQSGTSRVLFKDLTLRSKGIAQYNEHTFLLEMGVSNIQSATIDDIRVDNVSFERPCGDGIFLSGGDQTNATFEVTNVEIRNSRFIGAHRRGITPNYSTRHLVIADNLFSGNNGAIDFDVTRDVADATIENNLFINADTEAVHHIQIEGSPGSFVDDVHVVRNVLIGGGIDASLARNLEIVDNVIVGPTDAAALSDVRIHASTDRIDLRGNVISRRSPNPASPVLFTESDAGDVHSDVLIHGNTVYQPAFSYTVPPSKIIAAIYVEDTKRHRIQDNVVMSAATANPLDPTRDNSGGIFADAAHTDLDTSSITGNAILGTGTGPLGRGIGVTAEGATVNVGTVSVLGNTVTGAKLGLELQKTLTSTFSLLPFISANVLDATTTAIGCRGNGCDAVFRAYVISGNRGGPIDIVGKGVPQGDPTANPPTSPIAAPDGSTYVNATPNATPVLYIRAGGAWISK